MNRGRALILALAGLALPIGLALGVYVASAGSLATVPAVIQPPTPIARAATTTEREPTQSAPGQTTTAGENDDLPGKCKDPKHRLDPDCDPRSAEDDDDSSGEGSDGDGDEGDDDLSGHGSGGDD